MSHEVGAGELTLPIKRTTGETLEDRLTDNAYYNILPARYLRKDGNGEVIETQEELFERVAKNVALAEAVFEARNQDVEITVTPAQLKPDHPRRDELAAEVFGKGTTAESDSETTLSEYNVNKFSYETVVPELPESVREHVEDVAAEFQESMEKLDFTPNCVPPDSLVAAGGGMKELSEVEPGERVYDDEDGNARVKEKYHNGEKPVLEIQTAAGYSVRATPEHYFRVIDERGEYKWRQVKDIEPDDVLALQKNFLDDENDRPPLRWHTLAADGGVQTAPTGSSLGRPRAEFEPPAEMTVDLAEWLGLYLGDGTARESGVRVAFDGADEHLVEYWTELTQSVFGFEPTTRRRADADCLVGYACRHDLYEFLDQNELLKPDSTTATVPDPILQSGRSCIAAFLRGLFEADGTVGERCIELYTHSEVLAQQVQKLLLGLGIRATVTDKRDGYRISVRKSVCGKRFVERIGFLSERKTEHAARFNDVAPNASSIKIPHQSERLLEWYRESELGHEAYRALSQFLIDTDSPYHQEIAKEIFERYAEKYPELWNSPVAEHVERDQFYERVESVTLVGTMAVEDMQVPRRNTYVVEGFVSHNSPTLMNAGDELQQLSACFVDSPEDDIDDIHQTAKEAAQVFQCLTAEATVHVDGKGVISISDVEPGDEIRQRDGREHRSRTVEETHAYDDAPVYLVETEAGIELTGTPNHELLVDGDWTRIDEIEPGETLSVRLGWIADTDETDELTAVTSGGQWGTNRVVSNDEILELYPNGSGGRKRGDVSFDAESFTRLYEAGYSDSAVADELEVSTRTVARYREQQSLDSNGDAAKVVTQPETLTPELAELLGMWVGDGSIHEDGIRFHLNREETLEHADHLCRQLFDEGLHWRWDSGCYEAVLHSHEIRRWWLANFGDAKPDAPSARVPSQVWKADHESTGAFLRGLFSTDGSLQKGRYPRLWTASEVLCDDVQQLLVGLGMPALVWELDSKERDYYNVGVTGKRGLERFAELVGFVDSRNEQMTETLDGANYNGTTVGTVREDGTWEVPVKAVEEDGTDTVYDVTVADNHEYVASSVVSHNSGGGMGYAFWRLRPYGDAVGSTGGIASGPITFMRTFDQMCFPPGTRVLTPEGQRPIEELTRGEVVIDENGERQPVVETMERHVEESIVEIVPERLNRPIQATGEHPFKVVRDGDFEWVDAEDLIEGDLLVLGHSRESNDLTLDETVSLDEVASGPLVFTDGGITVNREYYGAKKGLNPASLADEVPVEAFATLAGWYLAEGCVVYRRGIPSTVTFTLHSDERDGAREIQDALDAFGVPSRIQAVENRNTLHVHAEHSSFAQFVDSLFGTGAAEKQVPDLLWNAPVETQARVLETLFAGDGRLEKRGNSQRAKLKLVNEEIVDFAFQVGLRCGVQFSRHDREPDDRQPTYEIGVSVSTALGTPLELLFEDVDEDFVPCDRTKQANGREVVAIDSVEHVEYEGPVYNAEVAGTHTYVAEDIVVHNCETIAQGGTRRGAQMGVMRVSHPDVIQFIHAKNKDVSLANTLRLNDPDDFTHTSFADALEEARELIDDDGRVPEHLRNAVEGHLSNFNISVGVTDGFMEALKNDEEYTFTNPRTEEPHVTTPETKELYDMFGLGEYVEVGEVLSIPAKEIWDRIIQGAHENGEPGVIYLERVNKEHSFDVEKHPDHRILATNPCGEQPLEEYEACNLGHINLSTLAATEAPDWRVWSAEHADEYASQEDAIVAFLEEAIDWEEFDRRIEMGTRFLENVVTMSDFPVEKIEETVREMRKIGLGIMGLAQLYIQLGMKYGSDPANEVARQLMRHINHRSKWASHELALERGSFAEWENSKYANPTAYREWFEHQTGLNADNYADSGFKIRNHSTTTIAPTGCIEENSLVSTDKGLLPIKELDETTAEFEQWDEIEVGVSTDGGTKTATAVYDNGFSEVRSIQTEAGFSIASTPNHRFRVINRNNEYEWRKADELEPGDYIVLKRGSHISSDSSARLDVSERKQIHHRSDPALRLPAEMTQSLATLLGFYMGDGHLHRTNGVELAVDSTYPGTAERLIELGEEVFGVTATTEEKSNCILVSIGGQHVRRFFEDNGWEKSSRSAFIPQEVLKSDESCLKSFLRGLFEADGTASRKTELVTTSEVLSKQVQTLLLNFGIVFKREERPYSGGFANPNDTPHFVVRGLNKAQDKKFLDEVGFITKTSEIKLKESSYRKDKYPPHVVELVRGTNGYYENCERSLKNKVNDAKRRNGLTFNLLTQVEERTDEPVTIAGRDLSSLYIDKVESVENDVAYTKDISVPSNNTYIANGFVTHNTTSMVGNTTGGCEPIYNVAYYKNVSDDVQGDEMLVEFDDYFLRVLEANDIDVEEVKQEAQDQMANNAFDGVESLSTVPNSISELFVTTGDLSAKEHASIQTACQKGVDSAISKTVNAPNDSTAEDAKEVFEYIYDNGGKGVTYYRDGTRSKQVLTTRAKNTEFADEDEAASVIVEQIRELFGGIEDFLENEDVRAELEADLDELFDSGSRYAEKKPRPDQLHGVTQRIETGYGKLYVTINEDPKTGEPFELFANTGHSGGFTNSFTDALAKTISVALRSGVDPYEIVDKLQGIRSPKVAWDKGEQINSIPDAFGTALRRYLDDEIDRAYPDQATLEETADRTTREPASDAGVVDPDDRETDGGGVGRDTSSIEDDHQRIIDAGESPECPECGSLSLYYSEGCKTCESCGWSEC